MKKIVALLLSLLLSVSLAACSDSGNSADKSSSSSSTSKTESVANDSSSTTESSSSPSSVASSSSSASAKKSAPKFPTGVVSAVVTKEVDGDTIHVNLNGKDETIRMLLIDTPETHKPGTPVETFGPQASAFAIGQMPVGTHIKLQIGKKGYERDKYDRLLAFIYLPNGQLYNEKIVRKGLARVAYIYPPNTQHLDALYKAQNYAKSRKLGIWSKPGYVTADGFNVSSSSKSQSASSSSRTVSHTANSSRAASSSSIAPAGGSESFPNCTALRKKYPNGVPKGHPAYQAKMDRDKDNYACER